MNVQHSSRSDKWYTPVDIIDRAKHVLGHIDVDPATDAFGNSRIGATYAITKEMDGLSTEWAFMGEQHPVTAFLNPPGWKLGNKSLSALFWQKLMQLRERGALAHAIFMAFSIEAMQTTQGKGCKSIGHFPCCIPAKRLRFDKPDGHVNSQAPSHSNVIVYVPGTQKNIPAFVTAFDPVGLITIPL